jgi:hypothetical protein
MPTRLASSIQGLDHEAYPRPEVPLRHGHHQDSRLTTNPRHLLALAFLGKRELEVFHQGRHYDQHFQDAMKQQWGSELDLDSQMLDFTYANRQPMHPCSPQAV